MDQKPANTASHDARVIFSATELVTIREEIRSVFALSLERSDLSVWFDGSLVEDRVHQEIRLSTPDQHLNLRMEAATEVNPKDAEDLINARVHVLELLVAMLEEWVEDGGFRSPNIDWESFTYENRKILYRGELMNSKLSSMADDFLRSHGLDPDKLYEDDDLSFDELPDVDDEEANGY